MSLDPFTQVLDKLWELLEAQQEVTDLVATHNRIKLHEGTSRPDKLRKSKADLPELRIEPTGGAANVHATSTGAQIMQRYGVGITDGDLRVHKGFFPLKWAVLKALASIDANLGLSFVRRIVLEDVTDMVSDTEHPGWTAGFEIVVEMWFDRATLKL